MATIRGFYRCPACGVKVPLAGQVNSSQVAHDRGERLAEALISGTIQAFLVAVDVAHWISYGVRFIVYTAGKWVGERRRKAENGGGVTPVDTRELAFRMAVMGAMASRFRPTGTISEAKECETCDL
jgi:hypothetical protein